MRELSAEGLRELFAQQSGDALLTLLTITHSTISEPVRLVNDRKAMTYGGESFTPLPFELTLPTDTEEEMPTVQLKVDNVGRVLTELLRSVSEPPTVELQVVRVPNTGSPVVELGPLEFALLDSQITASTVTCRLGYEVDLLNMQATQDIFSPKTAPALF